MALPKVGFDLGTVWVQVLPSYEGWERSLRRQAQKAGEAEGSARAAGDRKARVAAEKETAKTATYAAV